MNEERRSVGRYAIRRKLGAGGFGAVYRAHDPVLDREVALKVLHPHYAADPAIRERFVREGRALARVRHPNVVTVYEAGEVDGTVYLATDLIDGLSLDELIEVREPLPLAEVVQVTEQVAGALDAVHRSGLIHRDVKPANVLIERATGRAVLLDLGVARDTARTTITGDLLLGTPAFMAPEQVDPDAGPVSARTDVYQLGATVYALLTGRPPFDGNTTQILFQIVHRVPSDLAALRPDLPPAVVVAVAEAMAKEPDRRPADAPAFAAALRGAAATPAPEGAVGPVATASTLDGVTSAPTRPRTPATPSTLEQVTTHRVEAAAPATQTASRRLARWPYAAGAVVLALLLGAVAVALSRTGDDGTDRAGGQPGADVAGGATPRTGAGTAAAAPGAQPTATLPVNPAAVASQVADLLRGASPAPGQAGGGPVLVGRAVSSCYGPNRFRLTVEQAAVRREIGGRSPDGGAVWLVATVFATNRAGERGVPAETAVVRDSRGRESGPYREQGFLAAAAMQIGAQQPFAPVAPGDTAKVVLAWIVAADAEPFTLASREPGCTA